MIAVGGETVFHRLDHGGEKFVGNIGNDEADGLFLAGAEAPGGGVRRVAQLRNGPVDLIPGLAGNVAGGVNGVGDCGGGDTGQLCHIADCHLHTRTSFAKTVSRLRNHLHYTV